jgi:DNA-binding MarR family transcriptional regulator
VTLNISAKRIGKGTPGAGSAGAVQPARPLVSEVLEELSSWNPREFIAAFRRWHQGSFSLIHLNVLTLLEAEGPLSMTHLAEALDVTVASMTGIVDRMEKRRLVRRRRDAADRRVVLVEVAAAGRKVFGDIDRRRRVGLSKLLSHLSDEELAGLLLGHRALRTARQTFAETMTARKVPGSKLVAVETRK